MIPTPPSQSDHRRIAAAFGACAVLIATFGCTTQQTFMDPPSHCAITPENAFWLVANAATHYFANTPYPDSK